MSKTKNSKNIRVKTQRSHQRAVNLLPGTRRDNNKLAIKTSGRQVKGAKASRQNQQQRDRHERSRKSFTYRSRRETVRAEERASGGKAARLRVRSVTGTRLRLRADRRGGDEERRNVGWSEPLRAGGGGGGGGREEEGGGQCGRTAGSRARDTARNTGGGYTHSLHL